MDEKATTVIVLAMHGAPPKGFPAQDMAELAGLQVRLRLAAGASSSVHEPQRRHEELQAKLRAWPRTAENDPFYAASQELAASLAHVTGCQVLVGFNEFCSPTLEQALETALVPPGGRVVVVTPMLTRGGEHVEREIPAVIERVRAKHPGADITYAWPYDPDDVAQFLAGQILHSTVKEDTDRRG